MRFAKPRLPLHPWCLTLGLMRTAKQSLSSCQLGRALDGIQRSAWSMPQRIRAALTPAPAPLLQGLGRSRRARWRGPPRRTPRKDAHPPNKPGRGTKASAVIGALALGGQVVTPVVKDWRSRGLRRFLNDALAPSGSLLITDADKGLNAAAALRPHAVIPHAEPFARSRRRRMTVPRPQWRASHWRTCRRTSCPRAWPSGPTS